MFKQFKTRTRNTNTSPNRTNTACRLAKKYEWEYVAGTFHGNYTFNTIQCVITFENGLFCAYLTFPSANEKLVRTIINHRQLSYLRHTPDNQIVVGWEYEKVCEPVGLRYDNIMKEIRRISTLFHKI